MNDFVTYFVVAFVVVSVLMVLRDNRSHLAEAANVYRAGWRAYGRGFLIAMLSLNLGVAVFSISPEPLQWSWFQLLPDATATTSGTQTAAVAAPLKHGASAGGWLGALIIMFFYLALLLAMPFIARREEEIFRRGRLRNREMVIGSLKFGLMHFIFGVPLSLCGTLVVTGYVFARRYRRVHSDFKALGRTESEADAAGLDASTKDHTLHNFFLVTLIAAAFFWVALMPRP